MISIDEAKSKRRYTIRAKCPQCAYGDVSFLGPEDFQEKFVEDDKGIDILCPLCGTGYTGRLYVEEKTE
jgi:hypothetical protein